MVSVLVPNIDLKDRMEGFSCMEKPTFILRHWGITGNWMNDWFFFALSSSSEGIKRFSSNRDQVSNNDI